MKKLALFFVSCLLTLPLSAGTKESYQQLEKYLQSLAKHDKAMFAVAISEKGERAFESYQGYADLSSKKPLTAESKFRIGSITKTFTAVLIMQLVEQGKLSLDQPLADFYPQFKHAKSITIRHLLMHRSGIANYTDTKEFLGIMYDVVSKDKILNLLTSLPSDFKPDEKYSYSNSNYVLLGWILEDVTKQPYAQLIQQNISKPLGLTSTYCGKKIDLNDNEVYSFRYAGRWLPLPETNVDTAYAAGAIVSTANDLLTFMQALFNHKLVSKQSLEEMTQLKDGYGFALVAVPFNQYRFFGHGGRIDGFNTMAMYNQATQTGYVLLTNAINYEANEIHIAALSARFDLPVKIPSFTTAKPIKLQTKQQQKYVGEYSSPAIPLEIKVFVQNGQLHAQATGQGAIPLIAYDNHEFRFDAAGIVILFDGDSLTGNETSFTLVQAGAKLPFKQK